jgi:hypothetical protein
MPQAYKTLPLAAQLWESFEYKPLTGELVWRHKPSPRLPAGLIAGHKSKQHYVVIHYKGSTYQGHRLVWKWVTGQDPAGLQVDHVDTKKESNRWGNLRLATITQNKANSTIYSNNKLKVKGVYAGEYGKYRADIRHKSRIKHLGSFSTVEEAAAAYAKAAAFYHGEFARTE